MASISGRGYAGASNAAYAASKGAVIALDQDGRAATGPLRHQRQRDLPRRHPHRTRRSATRSARAAARGITVEEMQAEQERGIPIGRANTPEDIAAMAVFLASPGARNITGQSYNVDGGLVPS